MNELMGKPEVNKIVGMCVSDAIKHLDKHGYTFRTTVQNGRSLMVGSDIKMRRVNVFVVNDIVVDIDKMG